MKSPHILAFYLLIGILWSWPLALHPTSITLSQHFDQLPAAWLVHAAPSFRDGVSELSAWPQGEALVRLDSFLFLLLAMLLQGLIPGLLLTNLFVLIGPAISAWAAEKLAQEVFQLRPPASLIAGLAYGFAPLATVGVLEGHVYYLLNPWLPLCALHLYRNTPRNDAFAGLYWLLCLLTTAYMGINASILAAFLLLYRLKDGIRRIPWPFIGITLSSGLLYSLFFLGSGGAHHRDHSDAILRLGSATLTTLVAWNPWMDLNRHSLAPAFGVAPLALALLAPFVPGLRWRAWLGLGLACLIFSLGPVLEVGVARMEAYPTLLYPLLSLGVFDTFRFPIRLAWVGMLCFGLLAAAVVNRTRWPWLGVVFCLIDITLVSGGIFRMRPHPAPIPSLYNRLPEGPVLELYPEIGGEQEDMTFFQQNISCYYQLGHHHPILDRCLNTDPSQNPRINASRELQARLLDSEGGVRGQLSALKVRSIVMHLDLYQTDERAVIMEGLTHALGPPIGEGRDGGEWLTAWEVR